MGQPAEKQQRPATYADLEAVPEHMVAEIIGGRLYVSPRPAPKHAHASSILGALLVLPFQLAQGGPGGWRVIDEPELHLESEALVPDVAAWRIERLPELPETAYFPLAPDWVCEVLSPRTGPNDRYDKLPVYAREGVKDVWLVDPREFALEVHRLGPDGRYTMIEVHRGDIAVRIPPFDAIELPLGALWVKRKINRVRRDPSIRLRTSRRPKGGT
ncbi:Uma2 family endonuclease [Chondromyces apiculatus]|uniref:Putative restriction endonuclease domain-containing protein n=1 Tax=Chondromyces apiculatus DSM 436 TaxID=1192034 RepID=A0A017TF12_9BACT|nr:Uma2 family endonuclease [Chondromyces apiculatus]EYF07492.1 Hypothetical protein CAP_0245 [Chondromyces apiculatus DSM 436]